MEKNFETSMPIFLHEYVNGKFSEREQLLKTIFLPLAKLVDKIENEQEKKDA